MTEPTLRGRIIRTPQDAAQALTDEFLRNADTDANEGNDQLVEAIRTEQRRRQRKTP